MSLQQLDAETRALLRFAAAIAVGDADALEAALRACVDARVPALWLDELLLQSVLMVGWPRALAAFAAWRRMSPVAVEAENGADYRLAEMWRARGEQVCREVYGKNYERLRSNICAIHPSLEAWMITEGYGKTLGRPGLDLARRELCVSVQVAVQGAEPQLHSHLRGARHAGASLAAIAEALELIRSQLGRREAELAFALLGRIGA